MLNPQTLAKNTMFLTVASVGQKVIAFLYFSVIARTIGVENTGAYFLALAVVTTIGVLDDVGLTSVLIREVARVPEKAKEWTQNVIGAKCIAMPLTVLVAFFVPAMFGYDGDSATLVRIAIAIMLSDTLSLTFYGVLRGLHVLKYESLGIFVGQGLTAALGAVFLLTGHGTLPLLVVALIAGSTWNAVFSAVQVVRRLGIGVLQPSFSFGLSPLRAASAFFLAALFVKVYSYIDSFTLNAVIGKEAVGLYSVAYKLTYAFQFLPMAFVGALYPTFAAHVGNIPALRKTLIDALWYVALLAVPIVFGIFALAPEIVRYFYGAAYAGSVLPLSILIFVLLFIFIDFPIGALLNATGRQVTKTKIMGATMVVNAVANIVLVPRIGVPGASVAGLITFIFMCMAGWYCLPSSLGIRLRDLVRSIGGIVVAGIIMSFVVIVVKQYVYWMLAVPVGAAVFFAALVATKSFTIEHVRTFRHSLRSTSYANTPSDS